ncbi:hypothetical protein MBA17_08325 [Streptosporangium sp. KLBMP 9127]|nr:hypothetical protein [Streptosporangium sp. KLBMP 9127]
MEDLTGQGVAGFLPVKLSVDPAAQQFVVVAAGQVGGAIEFAQLHQGAPDGGALEYQQRSGQIIDVTDYVVNCVSLTPIVIIAVMPAQAG